MDDLTINGRLEEFLLHEGISENELVHYGVRGMKWGKRGAKAGAAAGAKIGGHLGAKAGSKAGNLVDIGERAGRATGRGLKKAAIASVTTVPSGPGAREARIAKSKQDFAKARGLAIAAALTHVGGKAVSTALESKSPAAAQGAKMVSDILSGALGVSSVTMALAGASERAVAAGTKKD